MAMMTKEERAFADLMTSLTYCNPFLPERRELEEKILGDQFVDFGAVWHAQKKFPKSPNVARIGEKVERGIGKFQARLRTKRSLQGADRKRYRDLVYYSLYDRYFEDLSQIATDERGSMRPIACYERFWKEHRALTEPMGPMQEGDLDSAHLFGLYFQIRRAFHHIFEFIIGGSMAAANLRASVWQSIFTHDLRRYRRALYQKMGDVVTLVTGPTGTGKELVARAVGLSRYLEFLPDKRTFVSDVEASFFPLNLSALSPTLIESELFGHRRGAFTGAVQDRAGWLEVCPDHGTVFLDEIGEVDPAIQVKLLRVLQSRTFQRLGESKDRRFRGKLVAATNRDPSVLMEKGDMREDFYYRLCSDMIVTPSLNAQIDGNSHELRHMLRFICRKCAGEEVAEHLSKETFSWIESNLGINYPWPGNVRELEQCVRNIMIRGSYHPAKRQGKDPSILVFERWRDEGKTLDDVTGAYCAHVYEKIGNYVEAGRQLGVDRRTLKAKVAGFLTQLEQSKS